MPGSGGPISEAELEDHSRDPDELAALIVNPVINMWRVTQQQQGHPTITEEAVSSGCLAHRYLAFFPSGMADVALGSVLTIA